MLLGPHFLSPQVCTFDRLTRPVLLGGDIHGENMPGEGSGSHIRRSASFEPQPRTSTPQERESPWSSALPALNQSSASSTGTRRARLTHRSRAGCWTCRGRKVKCDEQHPRCGPCARLDRDCDWEHRWNFNNATSTTQSRHTNVSTAGSVVWDPQARLSGRSLDSDDLPPFATLNNDEDRERKARSARPGTYSVVVTPESFANLPEYASSGSNSPTSRLLLDRRRSSNTERRSSVPDNNTVVLSAFEDTSILSTSANASIPLPARSSSLSGPSTIPTSAFMSHSSSLGHTPALLTSSISGDDDKLSACFSQYLVFRLIPWINDATYTTLPNLATNRDFIQLEAARFAPLRRAIHALSALHLYYAAQARLAEAVSYYDQALAIQTPLDQEEHLSDGVFLRHFLLYVYDIAMTSQPAAGEADGTSMSATNLATLQKLAIQRYERNHGERFAYVIWVLGMLDVEACLMGNGNCDYVRNLLQHNVMPSIARRLQSSPPQIHPDAAAHWAREEAVLASVLEFKQGIIIQLATLAQLASSLRTATSTSLNDETLAQCQASVQQAQRELKSVWNRLYPDVLNPNPANAVEMLPPRIRPLYQHAVSLYNAGVIYSRTSMFPKQRSTPIANQNIMDAEIEACKDSILSIASDLLANQRLEQRWIIFPVFIAGIASKQSDAMVQAMTIIRAYEGSGIGQNTRMVRQLLTAICEEQSRRVAAGQPMEEIDWQAVANEKGFRIHNCGL